MRKNSMQTGAFFQVNELSGPTSKLGCLEDPHQEFTTLNPRNGVLHSALSLKFWFVIVLVVSCKLEWSTLNCLEFLKICVLSSVGFLWIQDTTRRVRHHYGLAPVLSSCDDIPFSSCTVMESLASSGHLLVKIPKGLGLKWIIKTWCGFACVCICSVIPIVSHCQHSWFYLTSVHIIAYIPQGYPCRGAKAKVNANLTVQNWWWNDAHAAVGLLLVKLLNEDYCQTL